jgi:TolB-like protein
MSERVAFLVPIVIDDTSEVRADVPERFRDVQWTRLPGGQTPLTFTTRIQRLLTAVPDSRQVAPGVTTASPRKPESAPWQRALPVAVIGVALLALLAYLVTEKRWASSAAPATTSPAAAFSPPPHSIAVLPFVNMSGDKDQEYFSEGLTEELLDSLSRINGLQVAARTSSFCFQGEHADIATVAHRLNVGAVLEGSVRRSADTVRITAQLVSGSTGFHIWSETYDRNLTDVLKLQSDIATAVASALKVTLLRR